LLQDIVEIESVIGAKSHSVDLTFTLLTGWSRCNFCLKKSLNNECQKARESIYGSKYKEFYFICCFRYLAIDIVLIFVWKEKISSAVSEIKEHIQIWNGKEEKERNYGLVATH